MVEPHDQACFDDTVGQLPHQVTVGAEISTVPIPVLAAREVAPPLVVLGGQDHIWRGGESGRGTAAVVPTHTNSHRVEDSHFAPALEKRLAQ